MTVAVVTPAIWKAGVSGSYETAANWKPAAVPDEFNNAVINKAGQYTVTATSDHTVNNLTLGNTSFYAQGVTLRVSHAVLQVDGGKITNTGIIQLDKNGGATDSSLLIDGDTILTGGSSYGAIYMGGPAGGGASVIGTAAGFAGIATFKVVNNLIGGSGQIGDANMKLINQGGTIAAWGGVLTLDTGANAIASSGMLEGSTGATLKIASALNNSGNVESDVGGTVTMLSSLTNSGYVSSNASMSIAGKVANSGTIQSFGVITEQGALNNSGTVSAIGYSSTYTINNNVTNTGTMEGHYHGALHVTGNVSNSTAAALIEATITGTVQIDGNLTNAGTVLSNGLDAANGITMPDLNPDGSLGYHTQVMVAGKVMNSGTIDAKDYSEIQIGKVVFDPVLGDYVASGGVVNNTATGVIQTSGDGGLIEIMGNVANAGKIVASHGNIFLDAGLTNTGTVTATLSHFDVGGHTNNSGTITATTVSGLNFGDTDNSGTIETKTGAEVRFFGDVDNSGTVKLSDGLSDVSHAYADFGNSGSLLLGNETEFDISGSLQNSNLVKVSGNSELWVYGDVQNTGTLEADAASAIFAEGSLQNAHGGSLISDGGYIRVAGGATGGTALIKYQGFAPENASHPEQLQLGGAIEFEGASNIAVTFQDTTANVLRQLILDDAHDYRGTVSGFGHGDAIEMVGFSAASPGSATFSYHDRHDGTGYLSISDAAGDTARINMAGTYTAADFTLSQDTYGDLAITHHGESYPLFPSAT